MSALIRCCPSSNCHVAEFGGPRDPMAVSLNEHDRRLAHPADEQAADRIVREHRVEKASHPHLVPHGVALDEGESPGVVPIEASPHEISDGQSGNALV